MINNVNDYIKEMDLSPELEEKAKKCKNSSELMELAAENDIELPFDALEMVSGGECAKSVCSHDWCYLDNHHKKCSKCGETMYVQNRYGSKK
jgi:acetyl-CoA carboxylase beta subunit